MKLAHPLHDRLAALDVGLDAERRILGREPLQALPAFSSPFLVFGSMAISMTGSGNVIVRAPPAGGIAASVAARRRVLEIRQRDDVAGERLVDLLAVDRVHCSSSGRRARLVEFASWSPS